jgi:hypothetical protein
VCGVADIVPFVFQSPPALFILLKANRNVRFYST